MYGHQATYLQEGDDYFFARVPIGQPPQFMDFIIDSGSSLPYIPCKSRCKKCGTHTHPYYDSSLSDTYEHLSCKSEFCESQNRLSCAKDSDNCVFKISYAEGSAVTGSYFKETIPVNGHALQVYVGCIETETSLIYGQDADGIMGISNEPLALSSQILLNKDFQDTMQLCLAHDGGYIEFGNDAVPSNMTYVPLAEHGNCRQTKYKADLKALFVDGEPLLQEGDPIIVKSQEACGSFFDTGCTDTLIKDKALYDAIIKAISSRMKFKKQTSTSRNACFMGDLEEMRKTCPTITWDFGDNVKLDMKFSNLFSIHSNSKICTTVYNEGKYSVTIGGNAMKNNLIVINKEKNEMGILPTDCKKRAEFISISEADDESIEKIPPGHQKRHPEITRERPGEKVTSPREPLTIVRAPDTLGTAKGDTEAPYGAMVFIVLATFGCLLWLMKKYEKMNSSRMQRIPVESWSDRDMTYRDEPESTTSSSFSNDVFTVWSDDEKRY